MLEDSDYEDLAKVIELRKIERNTRLFDIGEPIEELLVVLRGQVGIIYPSSTLVDLAKNGPENIRTRAELLTDQVAEQKKAEFTFVTKGAAATGDFLQNKEMAEKHRRLQEKIEGSKKNNATYQMFDAMLGLKEDPRVKQSLEANPLYTLKLSPFLQPGNERLTNIFLKE